MEASLHRLAQELDFRTGNGIGPLVGERSLPVCGRDLIFGGPMLIFGYRIFIILSVLMAGFTNKQ